MGCSWFNTKTNKKKTSINNKNQKESSQCTKENKLEVTRPLCLTFGMSTLQAASQQVDY
jgi:hypothetical protein